MQANPPDESGLQHETQYLPNKEQACTCHRVNVGRTKICVLTKDSGEKIVPTTGN
jgi:hypothetical protein